MPKHATSTNTSPSSSYTIIDRLAAGGMGHLSLAVKQRPPEPATLVVLKTSWRRGSLDARRLASEADLGIAAAGPGVVAHLGFFQAHGRAYIELEPIDGLDGAALIRIAARAGLQVPPFVAVSVAVGLLDVLAHLERRGILHRDISPSNLMVRAGSAHVTLVDFGLARRVGPKPDLLFGHGAGKLAYMAPEQAAGGPVGPSADLYAASASLWCMLVGRPPLGRGTDAETLARLQSGDREAPSLYAKHIPKKLDALILSGLALRPADRPASAGEMRTRLMALLPDLLPSDAHGDHKAATARWIASLLGPR